MADVRIWLSELETTAGGDRQFLQTQLKNEGKEGFSLTLLDGENVWEGSISENDLDQLSAKLKMDFNSYVAQTRAAFTQEDVADTNFECQFKSSAGGTAQLSWKKMPAHDIKYNLGSVTLKKCGNSASRICDVLSHCIANSRALESQIQSLKTDNERLALERQNALKRLDKCVTAKEELEKDLYSKFVLVLNSKKERIRLLEEKAAMESLENGSRKSPVPSTSREDSTSPAHVRKAVNTKNAAVKHKSDSASDDYGIDTDEEADKISNKKQAKKAAPPSKVKKLESSLNLGEDNDESQTDAAIVARRPRRQAVTKKQTPSRPTLPRVSSGGTAESSPRSAGPGRKSSLRKSGSNNSNKSSDHIDPDDLLDSF